MITSVRLSDGREPGRIFAYLRDVNLYRRVKDRLDLLSLAAMAKRAFRTGNETTPGMSGWGFLANTVCPSAISSTTVPLS